MNIANIIVSFSLGVIFGVFGSNSLYYFLSFLVLEIIVFFINKTFDPLYRFSVIVASILGYIIARTLVDANMFIDINN